MTTLDLGLLRFVFSGDFNASTTYELNTLVRYGGNVYVYISPIKTAGALPTDPNYWQKILDGFKFRGAFDATQNYHIGEVVTYGGNSYLAIADSVNKLPTDVTGWSLLNTGLRPMGDWTVSTQYLPNDIVTRGGSTYIALAAHISSTTFASDLSASKWKRFDGGIRWAGDWTSNTAYLTNDIVRYSGSSYLAIVDFTASSSFTADLAANKLQLLASGSVNTSAMTTTVLTVSKTVDVNTHYLVNTAKNSLVVKLPASPADGSNIKFTDINDCTQNPLVILTTDNAKIAGDKLPFSFDVKNASVLFIFNATSTNWTVK
jgi:hypothetical protein